MHKTWAKMAGSMCVVTILFFLSVNYSYALSDMMMLDFETCQEAHNLTQQDIEELKNHQVPTTKSGKCFMECMLQKMTIMEGHQINAESAGGVISQLDLEKEDQEKMTASVEECAAELNPTLVEDDPECDNGVKVSQCIHEKAQAKGVKSPDGEAAPAS